MARFLCGSMGPVQSPHGGPCYRVRSQGRGQNWPPRLEVGHRKQQSVPVGVQGESIVYEVIISLFEVKISRC